VIESDRVQVQLTFIDIKYDNIDFMGRNTLFWMDGYWQTGMIKMICTQI
jgi:hypothetical protein